MSSNVPPSPWQAGLVIARSIFGGPCRKLALMADTSHLSDAHISVSQYENETLLLCYAAALHTIREAVTPTTLPSVVEGFLEGIEELPDLTSEFLKEHLESAVESYAKAWAIDSSQEASAGELTEIEEEFGERLLALGELSEMRGNACIYLCMVIPKTLWNTQINGTLEELHEAKLVTFS